jgi:protein-tyrosine phosphatase
MNALDVYTEIEPGLWMGACPPFESPEFAQAVLNLFGLHDYERRCKVYREERLLDLTVDDPELVESLALWVDDHRKRDLTVLIHCEEGRNRSGLITALYLIRYRGMQPQAAIDLVRERRGPSALWNGSFVRYLTGTSELEDWSV